MKRIIIAAALLAVTICCGGCRNGAGISHPDNAAGAGQTEQTELSVQKNEKIMSYDEIMRLPTVQVSACDRMLYTGIGDHIKDLERRNIPTAFASGICLSNAHYMCIDEPGGGLSGYTLCELRITDIAENYHELSLSIGDTVIVRQDYYIRPTGVTALSLLYLRAQLGDCEIIPLKNGEYELCVGWHDVPMNPGEEYSFEIYNYGGEHICSLIYPMSDDSLLIQNDWYSLPTEEDIMEVSAELRELVRNKQ